MFYFALLGKHNQVVDVVESAENLNDGSAVRLTFFDKSLIGKEWYENEFVEFEPPSLKRVALIDDNLICTSDGYRLIQRVHEPYIEVKQTEPSILGFSYNSTYKRFDPPVQKNIINLANSNVTAPNENNEETALKAGAIWWLPVGVNFTLSAESNLAPMQLMVMIEKVVRDRNGDYVPVDDVRVKAVIDDTGKITMVGRFRESGNYRITAERLNMGLNEIGAPFNLDFEQIEFDAYEPA